MGTPKSRICLLYSKAHSSTWRHLCTKLSFQALNQRFTPEDIWALSVLASRAHPQDRVYTVKQLVTITQHSQTFPLYTSPRILPVDLAATSGGWTSVNNCSCTRCSPGAHLVSWKEPSLCALRLPQDAQLACKKWRCLKDRCSCAHLVSAKTDVEAP